MGELFAPARRRNKTYGLCMYSVTYKISALEKLIEVRGKLAVFSRTDHTNQKTFNGKYAYYQYQYHIQVYGLYYQ